MARAVKGDPAAAPDAVLRLAVLLQAGVSPARAWTHLAEAGDPVALRMRERLDEGMPLPAAIAADGGAWADVGAAWSVAATVGAPLAETLRGFAAVLRDAQETADQVRIALAEPAGTAKLMGWLPLVTIGLGAALGFDTLAVLLTHPAGLACLGAGLALLVAAHRWTALLVRRAGAGDTAAGLGAELLAIALSGGVSLDRARALLAESGAGAPDAEAERVLALSRSAGVPAVELLRAAASHARHRARVDGRLRAAKLSSRLLLPLGVCTLPAFLLLGVAPMILSVMSTMSLTV
ncbi:type II secretion system F family protein [Microbacterium ulmi]|uniref:Pilus assembly protein TadB n=1 Tax=Microbacterium ulmi TaxID=179095 RepID=A0A7Y2M2G7_9MICO|nr:type II secretion system F family protein [Microbacterium ulmi]NII68554.1 tight adherence protein B [Microbacterium ulmi]NNH05286.1 pilus assembly protein TadB [Microbacterium ulmi]